MNYSQIQNVPHVVIEWVDGAEWGEPHIVGWSWQEYGYDGYVGSAGLGFDDFEDAIADLMGYLVSVGRFDLPQIVIPHGLEAEED
jgi:hypothetical protein